MPYVYPVPGGVYERVDQGVDYTWTPGQGTDYAVAPGTIFKVGSFGSFQGVYEQFDYPVSWHGHTYPGAYYAEGAPLVGEGHIGAGTALMRGEYTELGFLDPGLTVPRLQGGLGAGTLPTYEGYDFKSFIESLTGSPSPTIPSPQTPATPGGPAPTHPPGACPGGCPPGQVCIGRTKNVMGDVEWECRPIADTGQPYVPGKSDTPGAAVGAVADTLICKIPCFGLESSICSGKCWLRVFEIVGGAVLLLLGIYLLGRQMGAPSAFKVTGLPSPAEEVTSQAEAASTAVGSIPSEDIRVSEGRHAVKHRRAAGAAKRQQTEIRRAVSEGY